LSDVFQELVAYREQLGLPPAGSETDRDTVAKLEIGGMVFLGVNSSSNPTRRQITLRVNPISRTHAEADAFQQAYDLGIRGGKARLIVDRDLCRACGQNGGVKGMARQLDIEEIEVALLGLRWQVYHKGYKKYDYSIAETYIRMYISLSYHSKLRRAIEVISPSGYQLISLK
jgi:MafB19-like deaminase